MTSPAIVSGVVAAVVFGFGAQNHAMLTAGAKRMLRPVIDSLTASLCGLLMMFATALAVVHLAPSWLSTASIILASLFLALAGMARFLAAPGRPRHGAATSWQTALPIQHMQTPESWAIVFLLAGSARNGTVTLAAAFVGLTLLAATGLSLWAAAGWSGCRYLASGWHRRHLDWGFGILLFVAAISSLMPSP